MPSQEEYLDQLLRNIMNGGKGQPPEESESVVEGAVTETAQNAGEMYAEEPGGETQWSTDMERTVPEMPIAEELSVEPDSESLSSLMGEMPAELPAAEEQYVEPELDDMSAFIQGTLEELPGMFEEVPGELPAEREPSVDLDMPDLSALMEEMRGTPEEMSGMFQEMPGEMAVGEMPLESGMAEEMPVVQEVPEEIPAFGEKSVEPNMDDLSALMAELQGMAEEMPVTGEPSVEPDMGNLSAFAEEVQGETGDKGDTGGAPVEDDIEELFKTFEEELDIPGRGSSGTFAEELPSGFPDVALEEEEEEPVADAPATADISSMSEADIERLLAESSGTSENNSSSPEEAFQGDVVDLLEGTEDGELQEIQELLEKSDNNEAVDDEIEAILKEAVQESYQNAAGTRRSDVNADHEEGAEEQPSSKQQKAMEKKRLKEEKAAAKKAAKEARKAEKAAKKAARKGGQDAEAAVK